MNGSVLVAGIGWTLVHFVWQGALIGCATAVALLAMRNARPEHRYTVACSALLLCLAWPALELYLRLAAPGATGANLDGADLSLAGTAAASVGALACLQDKLAWIVGFWAVCAVALGLRMALGLLWIARTARCSPGDAHWQARLAQLAAGFGVTREVRLRIVDNLASPVTAGWWRPVVLVPASLLSGMPPHLLEALLAHEMAHVKRFDYLVNLGQNVIEALLFYHPAVWWISRRIRVEREQIADDFAARQLGEPQRLALALSELERFQFSTHHLAQGANGGDLMARIKRLVRPDSQALNWKAAIPVLGLAAAFLAGCAHKPVAETYTPGTASTKPILQFANCARPVYPPDAIRHDHTGTVELAFLIGTEGKVLESKVVTSSGHATLDQEAHQAIAKCPFKPATEGGKPQQAWVTVKYVWSIENTVKQ
jgi:D-alanyl-D-alanine endopeptidase (penicillin-binding protein 7)